MKLLKIIGLLLSGLYFITIFLHHLQQQCAAMKQQQFVSREKIHNSDI